MKRFLNLKMWGYFLMMALCVSLTACSEDDEENENGGGHMTIPEENKNGDGGSSSFIGTSMQVTEDGETENYLFTYDSQGRIIKVSTTIADIKYTYENDKIIVTVTAPNTENGIWYYREIYNLNNKGLIISSESRDIGYNYHEYIYEYDEQNRLIRYTSDYYWNEFIWNGGNIVKDGDDDITYYEGKEDTKGINGNVLCIGDSRDQVLYAGGYFGQKSANLIKSAYGENYSYTFEGDKVKTMTVNDGSESKIYTFNY